MDDYSGIDDEALAKLMTPFQHVFGVVEPVTNYCSLVDMRCRLFIHCMSAASV